MSKSKNGGLGQYGAERFEQQEFGTADVEGVNYVNLRNNFVDMYISVQWLLV